MCIDVILINILSTISLLGIMFNHNGLTFIISLFSVLYVVFSTRMELSKIGTFSLIMNGFLVVYSGLYIFSGIDLFIKLGLK